MMGPEQCLNLRDCRRERVTKARLQRSSEAESFYTVLRQLQYSSLGRSRMSLI
jgi:hypothetical protein